MTHALLVRAPCRLHFGMFSFGRDDGPQFGGVGAMVDPPAVELTIKPADEFRASGALHERVEQFTRAAAARWQLEGLPACEIKTRALQSHSGLGVGTQLGLAVAAGLRQFLELPKISPADLAVAVGRGARSAVGTYGFERGGLIVESGKLRGEPLGALTHHLALPDTWRFVLINPTGVQGLAGDCEARAFAELPPVPIEVTRELWEITERELLPAAAHADCAAFGDALYRFGRLAGECFGPAQGGPFASPEITQLVETLRADGVRGVGQSSWGPTVFALTPDSETATALVQWLNRHPDFGSYRVSIASPNNRGATIETVPA